MTLLYSDNRKPNRKDDSQSLLRHSVMGPISGINAQAAKRCKGGNEVGDFLEAIVDSKLTADPAAL